jgi:hypothetical protein
MAKRTTVPVTMRALIQRINRKLKPEGEVLKVARPRAVSYVGQYFIINYNGRIANQRVDPEALGRKLGALAEYEHVEEQ